MNKKLITEAMARADGYTQNGVAGEILYRRENEILGFDELPDYFTDNEIDRMVRGLSPELLREYYYVQLNLIITKQENEKGKIHYDCEKAQATAAQKVEAYLKAIGKWTKEME